MTDEILGNDHTVDMVMKRYDELRGRDPDNPLLSWVRILNGGRVMIKTPGAFYERFNQGHDNEYRIEISNYSQALKEAVSRQK